MKSRKTIIYVILTAVWSIIILSFSAQSVEQSAGLSLGILKNILSFIYKYTHIVIKIEDVHNLFRKSAHFSEFFVLGALTFLLLKTFSEKVKYKPLWVILYSFLWAFIDELSQFLYGQGRGMSFFDMLIDTSGAICGMLIIMLFFLIFRRKRLG